MDRVSERVERGHYIPVENQTESSTSRVTVDGRKLTYRMSVLQQPVRARACGQGAKSSADRRPVDPPPIVELKIFEGEDQENDITFTMHANYFLFATLEQARPIANGRVSNERSTPVLTGTPVAGMVYLDRPAPAGYFIFPDLSVRHEGVYRLSFSLYEDCKSPKDEDKTEDGAKSESDAHVTHRLEVKSEPFNVFSAKKFPGLTESTSLSRMVAEQGCRVRIRRDVRMRKRETKPGGREWDNYEDETAQARARVSATPESSGYQASQNARYMDAVTVRPRSTSNTSHQSVLSRRPSVQELGQNYGPPHYGTAPHTPQTGYQSSSFGGPSPGQQYQTGSYAQQQAPMQPPAPQYGSQTYPQPPPPPPNAVQQPGYYGYSPRIQSRSQFGAGQPASYETNLQQRPGSDYSTYSSSDYSRSSTQFAQPGYSQQSVQSPYQPQQSYQAPPPPPPQQTSPQPSQHSYGSSADMHHNDRPAPLGPVHPSRNSSMAAPQSARPNFDLPPINTTIIPASKLEVASPMSAAQTNMSYFSSLNTSAEPQKRSYGNVFSNRHHAEPLRQGARPNTTYGTGAQSTSLASLPVADDDDDDNDNDELDPTTLGMHYRRADGRQILRALPGHG
ncbi:unnamed protein product [Zymoseptoria tritici ST99CH_1A5]|uniref:Velvet domain-containing protein n=1 Tax=Zymoseptoria tritici ST99CH_1A5 TaxID=1276529 RepID=A0A1Y6LDT4_ZYMTR|nr:unnamed protein product [Zymoseptoria tritici ST99CH_1A5]